MWKFIGQLLLAGALFLALSAWQERNLLDHSDDTLAPAFSLPQLQAPNAPIALSDFANGKPTLVYFFAPWCSICRVSMPNLDSAYQSGTFNAVAIALDYKSSAQVREFSKDLGLTMPVLLGNTEVQNAYQISAFPTYYVISPEGKITARAMGYSSFLGIKART